MNKLPTLFLSHGAPNIVIDKNNPTHKFFKELANKFPKPDAIVVFSAHWQSGGIRITGSEKPQQIYDFGGFEKELYEFKYTPNSNLELAKKIKNNLEKAGYKPKIDEHQGFDHGLWAPLALIYPNADIPVVQISLPLNENAEFFYDLGSKLSWLCEENILVIGTGNITHNLREAFSGNYSDEPKWVNEFAEWVYEKLNAGDINSLLEWKTKAPNARQNHPTDEHLLPFFASLGAAGNNAKCDRIHKSVDYGVLRMDAFSFV